jgi:UDP-2,3-diacylglucosamine pyrophosphatase LpxH
MGMMHAHVYIVSDIHFGKNKKNSDQHFDATMNFLKKNVTYQDTIILLGDLVHGRISDAHRKLLYTEFGKHISECLGKKIITRGNHDHYSYDQNHLNHIVGSFKLQEQLFQIGGRTLKISLNNGLHSCYQSNQTLWVVVDTSSLNKSHGAISESIVDIFNQLYEADLSSIKNIIVCSHHPMFLHLNQESFFKKLSYILGGFFHHDDDNHTSFLYKFTSKIESILQQLFIRIRSLLYITPIEKIDQLIPLYQKIAKKNPHMRWSFINGHLHNSGHYDVSIGDFKATAYHAPSTAYGRPPFGFDGFKPVLTKAPAIMIIDDTLDQVEFRYQNIPQTSS